MIRNVAGCVVHVEGHDDEHVIRHLLLRHGVAADDLPGFVGALAKDGVLKAMKVAVPAGTGRSLGFVLDANDDPEATWSAARSRLIGLGVGAPVKMPGAGFVGESAEFGARVGVWLMPDNRRAGAVEDFLKDLIEEADPLLSHAESATGTARELGARFGDADARKAVLHAWLAWQRNPGRPYGVAIKARFFRHDSDAAMRFVAWFGRLCGLAGDREG